MIYDKAERIKNGIIARTKTKPGTIVNFIANGKLAVLHFDITDWEYIITCAGVEYRNGVNADRVLGWLINNGFIDNATGTSQYSIEE